MSADKLKKWKRVLIPMGILLGGILIMGLLIASRKKPQRHHVPFAGVLVEVMDVSRQPRMVPVNSNGTVRPRKQVQIVPQVGGKVDWVNPEFLSGSFFNEGDTLFHIESIDYELAVAQAEAAVAQAEYGLEVTKANAEIARQEWEVMNASHKELVEDSEGLGQEPSELVLYEPQLRQAEANVKAAQAGLERAKLNLSRTVITAPFNCVVQSERVDPGQLVSAAAPIATVFSTDLAEIEVGLPQEELQWISIPGAEAQIHLVLPGKTEHWQGYVERQLGTIEETGRLAKVVVVVKDPFNMKQQDRTPLRAGTFVDVEIRGRTIGNAFPIPRKAFRENSTVWLVDDSSRVEIRTVHYITKTQDEVLIDSGLNEGDKLITTPLTGVADGLKVRMVKGDAA